MSATTTTRCPPGKSAPRTSPSGACGRRSATWGARGDPGRVRSKLLSLLPGAVAKSTSSGSGAAVAACAVAAGCGSAARSPGFASQARALHASTSPSVRRMTTEKDSTRRARGSR